MTNRQKFIASCSNPYYDNFATKEEVKEAKQLARGKYWNDDEMCQYVAFSPGGKRCFFDYDDYDNSKSISKKSALLWVKGQCAKAKDTWFQEGTEAYHYDCGQQPLG